MPLGNTARTSLGEKKEKNKKEREKQCGGSVSMMPWVMLTSDGVLLRGICAGLVGGMVRSVEADNRFTRKMVQEK